MKKLVSIALLLLVTAVAQAQITNELTGDPLTVDDLSYIALGNSTNGLGVCSVGECIQLMDTPVVFTNRVDYCWLVTQIQCNSEPGSYFWIRAYDIRTRSLRAGGISDIDKASLDVLVVEFRKLFPELGL